VVVTTLSPGYPLIRFATGDLSAVLPGTSACGRTHQRLRGWLGRADQSAKARGMFVHAGQVADLVKRHPEVLKARLVISGELAQDHVVLQVETQADAAPAFVDSLAQTARDLTKLRVDVQRLPPGSLPNDGKLIEDRR
jgi:phenylacetate-CoA ligase